MRFVVLFFFISISLAQSKFGIVANFSSLSVRSSLDSYQPNAESTLGFGVSYWYKSKMGIGFSTDLTFESFEIKPKLSFTDELSEAPSTIELSYIELKPAVNIFLGQLLFLELGAQIRIKASDNLDSIEDYPFDVAAAGQLGLLFGLGFDIKLNKSDLALIGELGFGVSKIGNANTSAEAQAYKDLTGENPAVLSESTFDLFRLNAKYYF
jgi:hypothetical protein